MKVQLFIWGDCIQALQKYSVAFVPLIIGDIADLLRASAIG